LSRALRTSGIGAADLRALHVFRDANAQRGRYVEGMIRKPKSNAGAFRSLEAEHAELRRVKHQTTKAAAAKAKAQIAKVEEQIKNICDLANFPERLNFGDERLSFGEHLISLLRGRFRSSANAGEYAIQRERLLARLGEVSANKHRRTLAATKLGDADDRVNRDRQMAEEFIRKKKLSTGLSDTQLMVAIGKKYRLKKSAAIEAIKRGLKALKA
jgi:hypothetical protein